jgi:hypothetical protein
VAGRAFAAVSLGVDILTNTNDSHHMGNDHDSVTLICPAGYKFDIWL